MRDKHTPAQVIKHLSLLEGILVPPIDRWPEGGTRMLGSGLKSFSPRDVCDFDIIICQIYANFKTLLTPNIALI